MNVNEMQEMRKLGTNQVTERPTQGKHLATKLNADYSVIKKIGGGWQSVNSLSEVKKGDKTLTFANVQTIPTETDETEKVLSLSIPDGFIDMPVNSAFRFDTNEKGYSTINTEPLTKKQVKAIVEGEIE